MNEPDSLAATEPSGSLQRDNPLAAMPVPRLNARLKRIVKEATQDERVRVRGTAWDVTRPDRLRARRIGSLRCFCGVF